MPATHLSCRRCGNEYRSSHRRLPTASGRSSPSTTCELRRGRSRRESIAAGRPRSGATRRSCLSRRRRSSACAPGWTPLVQAPRLADAARRRRALAQARHGEPDALVQGSRRRRRRREGDRARPHDARLLVDRQPRECGRRARRGRGSRRRRSSVRPISSGRSSSRRPSTARRSSPSRAATTIAAVSRRAVVRARLGVRQRRAPLVLRRGLEDARLRDRGAARLDASRRRDRADRVGGDVLEVHRGFGELLDSASSTAGRRGSRRPGGRVLAGRACVRRRREVSRCARTRSRVARDRQSRRRRATPLRRRVRRAARSTRSRRTRWRRTSGCSPRRPASSARPRPVSRSARCARRSGAASSARRSRRPARHGRRAEDARARGRPVRPDDRRAGRGPDPGDARCRVR